jgi:hypothetical protein
MKTKKKLISLRKDRKFVFIKKRFKRALFRHPVFYFMVQKTVHNLFLTVLFYWWACYSKCNFRACWVFQAKKVCLRATARLIAKLLVEKFYKHSLVRRL